MDNDNNTITLVIVTRIDSFNDPNTGRLGKRIELALTKEPINGTSHTETIETKIVKEMITQLQALGIPLLQPKNRFIKMILYLLPEEEKALGINFQVNHVYKIKFDNNMLKFEDVTDEYYLFK